MHKACLASPLSWLTLPPAITGSATYTSSPRNKYCAARVPRNGRLMAPPDKRPPPLSQGVSRPGLSPASHTLLLQLFSISHFGQVHCSSAKAPDHCFCPYQYVTPKNPSWAQTAVRHTGQHSETPSCLTIQTHPTRHTDFSDPVLSSLYLLVHPPLPFFPSLHNVPDWYILKGISHGSRLSLHASKNLCSFQIFNNRIFLAFKYKISGLFTRMSLHQSKLSAKLH